MNEKCKQCQWFYTDANCCVHESKEVHFDVTHGTSECIGFTKVVDAEETK